MSAPDAPGGSPKLSADPDFLLDLVRWRMPFGKYQGRRLCDLPGAYLVWFSRQGFPRGKLGALLRQMLELEENGLRGVLEPLRQQAEHDADPEP